LKTKYIISVLYSITAVLKTDGNTSITYRFIGELFKLGMLTTPIMQRCIKDLLEAGDEESLECLCKLLTTIGKDLENKNHVCLFYCSGSLFDCIVHRHYSLLSSLNCIYHQDASCHHFFPPAWWLLVDPRCMCKVQCKKAVCEVFKKIGKNVM
jgi:hypothetical protein